MLTPELQRAEGLIREIPDHPEPGILFRDITPLLADGAALRAVTAALAEPHLGRFDVVAGIEARGFLLAGTIAATTGTGLVPIRKAGKLPRPAASVAYDLEYGRAEIEAHDDIGAGTRVLIVDDVLATGGTLSAACELVAALGGEIAGTGVLIEIEALRGRMLVPGVHTVFTA